MERYGWALVAPDGEIWGFAPTKRVYLDTLIKSKSTSQKAMNALLSKHFAVRSLTADGSQDVDQVGALYRIMTPSEIAEGRTEEGVVFDDIPLEGVPMIGIPTNGIPENVGKQGDNEGMMINGIPNKRYTDNRYTDNEHTSVPNIGIPKNGTPEVKAHDKKPGPTHTDERYTDNHTPFKEDGLKDSLSPDPVKLFYTGLGQQRISKVKREKGNSVLKELQKEGFSPEDIQFAIEWTLKPENTKEKIHDFSIISHTIGQALSAREAEQQAADATQKEAARVEAAEEERRRLEGEIQEMRSRIAEDELVELRKKALEELRNTDGIKKQFMNEPLITAKENEILQREKSTK